jgi:hypothetical protein
MIGAYLGIGAVVAGILAIGFVIGKGLMDIIG